MTWSEWRLITNPIAKIVTPMRNAGVVN
jgi:hypothetical protein